MKKYIYLMVLIFFFSLNTLIFVSADSVDNEPIILGNSNIFFAKYDEVLSIEDIKSSLVANDDVDGDLTNQIYLVSNDYTGNENVFGDHDIVFGVKDSLDQEALVTITIRVVEVEKPIIYGVKDITINKDNEFYNLMSGVTAIDNYDGNVTANIEITTDLDVSIIGDYDVTYSVTDSNGNNQSITITVSVIDGECPVITGGDVIYKSTDYTLSLEDIKSLYTVTDDVDGDLSKDIEVTTDEYTGNGNVDGEYNIVLKAVDSSENVTIKNIHVRVLPTNKKLMCVENQFYFDDDNKLSVEDIVLFLKQIEKLPNQELQINELTNTYSDSEDVGIYDLVLNIKASDGSAYDFIYKINVVNSDGVVIDVEETPTIFDKSKSFVKKWWIPILAGGFFIVGFIKKSK